MTIVKSLRTGEQEAEFRQLWSYLLEQSSTGKAKTGVVAGCAVTATTPSATGSVVIGVGLANVQPTTGGGAFPELVTAAETVDVFTANPMQFETNPRNDIIGITQDGAATVLVGTPNAIPTDPAVPSTVVPLARLRHAAGATTIPATVIDDLRVIVRPAEGEPRMVYLEKTTSGNVTTNTLTDLVWETRAPKGGVTATGTTITPGKAGYYVVEGYVSWTSSSGGWRAVQVDVDGSATARADIPGAAAQSGGVAFDQSFSLPFKVPTDASTVKIRCAYDQASPAALQVLVGTRAVLRYVGPL